MIKNRVELLKNIPSGARKRRKILLDIADWVLENCTPKKIFKSKFPKKTFKGFEKIAVISIGKAARGMAQAFLPLLGQKPDFALFADNGHPTPTEKGMENTKKIIKVARSLGEKDLAIVLISGGGSAMLCAPVSGITLEDKIKTTELLLQSGATIQEMNVIRKHLSQIKGGNLAALLYPAAVFGFVISDVVGNDLSAISSGPLSPDPSTFADAIKILKKYKIKAPKNAQKYLEKGLKNPRLETPKAGSKYFEKVKVQIIADHQTVLGKACEKAKKMGLKCEKIKTLVTGEARNEAIKMLKKIKSGKILVAAGETTVTCRGRGRGGRNQEFVLSALRRIKKDQAILSIGTDGIDGICPEPTAGAIADSETKNHARQKKLNADKFLNNNDSYSFFKRAGGSIITGPTGTNLGDLILLY